jgi:CubicO group peptidase (beta-lactamase class C family)
VSELEKQVQELIDGLVRAGAEDGVAVTVYQHGSLIVDAVAGVADVSTGRPVTSGTPFWSASTGKGIASTIVHVLAERGTFDYDTLVADLWPEFGAHGKASATLRHVLTHSVGVPAIPADTTLSDLSNWDHMCDVVASSVPWWAPGERVGYHAVTYGYIVGEIVRRATGKRISQVLAEEVAEPLGIADELYFGVPSSSLPRLATLVDDPAGTAVFSSLPDEFPLFKTAPRSLFPNAAYGNRAELLTADIPYCGTGTARAFARVYAALLGEVDGVRLVSAERLRMISTLAVDGVDEMTGGPAPYGLGYVVGLPWQGAPADNPSLFGMVGVGGSVAYGDTARGVSVAVTKNRFNPVDVTVPEKVNGLVEVFC